MELSISPGSAIYAKPADAPESPWQLLGHVSGADTPPGAARDASEPVLGQVCSLCDRQTERSVCPTCELGVLGWLAELAHLVDQLREFLAPVRTSDSGGARGKPGSRPPLSINILSLLGQNSKTDTPPHGPLADQSGNRSIHSVLANWAVDWARTGADQPNLSSITSTIEYLAEHNSWAVNEYGGYLDYCSDLRTLIQSCRSAMEAQPSIVFIGRCPVEHDGTYCSAKLYVIPGVKEITCTRCLNQWPKYEWRSLGAAITRADTSRDSA